MQTRRYLAAWLVLAWLGLMPASAQQIINCNCLSDLPVLRTNGCYGVIPDLCTLAAKCIFADPATSPCSQTPAPGGIVGPGVHPIVVTIISSTGVAQSCQVSFTVTAPPGGCPTNSCCPDCPVPFPASFTVTVNTGFNYLVNPLCHGNLNTVGVILANVPDQTGLSTWDKTQGAFVSDLFDVSLGGWSNPTQPLDPGVGFVLNNPGNPFTLTFTGCEPKCPHRCPLTNEVCLLGNTGAAQGVTTWASLFGTDCPPRCGSKVSIFNPATGGYTVYVYLNTGWSPSTPSWPNGTSVFISWQADPRCDGCVQQTNVWNTGFSNDGTLALPPGTPDANWSLVSFPAGGCNGPAQVLQPAGIPGVWIPNGPNSTWVGPSALTAQCAPGLYHYQLSFIIPCAERARIVGQFAADDIATLALNGVPQVTTTGSYASWTPVNISSGFLPAPNVNTLDLYVTNAIIYTGFRAELTNVFNDCCCTNVQRVLTLFSGRTNSPPGLLTTGSLDTQFSTPVPQFPASSPYVMGPAAQNPAWLPGGPNSLWIGPASNGYISEPGGVYAYTNRFYLPCDKAQIKGRWSTDDTGSIELNGVPTGVSITTGYAFQKWWPVSINTGFVAGWNTLVFYVTNYPFGWSPTGLRTELIGTAQCCSCWGIKCPPLSLSVTGCPPVMPDLSGSVAVLTNCPLPAGLTITQSIPAGTVLSPGVHVAIVRTCDGGGVCRDCDVVVTAVSECCVHIRCPSDILTNACGPTVVVQYPPPFVTSQCGTALASVVCVPPSGSAFPLGSTVVTCTATDAAGNKAKCTFTVTVTPDHTPPTLHCPPRIFVASCTPPVKVFYNVFATDNCPGPIKIVCVPPSGSAFGVGTTVVTCTATDASGNTTTCQFPVIVSLNPTFWQTLPCGVNDCYSLAGLEPTVRGACLLTAYPGNRWKDFDFTWVNRWVGHTWSFPASWTILGATLDTRARPPIYGCDGISGNDSISLGLANCTSPAWLWSRYLGSGNASPGLVNAPWCSGRECTYPFSFNLAALPLTPSGTISLLPHMNSVKRLDFFVQDDTTVDFARLRVLRCAPNPVIAGVGVALANAEIVHGDLTWSLSPVPDDGTPFGGRFNLGSGPGLRLPMPPLRLSAHPGAVIALGDGSDDEPGPERLRLRVSADGAGEISLGEIPPGVTQVEAELEQDGKITGRGSFDPQAGLVVAGFGPTESLTELGVANNNEFLVGAITDDPQHPGAKFLLRIRLVGGPRQTTSLLGLSLMASGIDRVDLLAPKLQLGLGGTWVSSSDAAYAEISGGQFVASPLDASVPWVNTELTAQFNPADEFNATLPSPFSSDQAPGPGSTLRTVVRGIIGGEEVDVDAATFQSTEEGWSLSWASERVHPVHRIYWVYGRDRGMTRFDADADENLDVIASELPTVYGKLGGKTPCRRFQWPGHTTLRINGATMEAVELRVLIETDAYPVTGLTGLRVEASGGDALVLARLEPGQPQFRLETPELSEDLTQVGIRWSGFGGILEESDSITGPWNVVADQDTGTPGEYVRRLDRQPGLAKFFRVRGD
ncbi:MAG: HYR domain-containing protein [Verrucomicrobia bacterium]|nr:HYR domain-containing protein [Verrucomicrobiota bacterium]